MNCSPQLAAKPKGVGPGLLVCLHCGNAESAIPESELRELAKSNAATGGQQDASAFHEKTGPCQEFFALSMSSSLFFPFSQAASVATLPSALLDERFSLGASWVFLIQ